MCREPVGRRPESLAQRRCFSCTDQLLPSGLLSCTPKYAGLLNIHTILADKQPEVGGLHIAIATSVEATGTGEKMTNTQFRSTPMPAGREKDLLSWSTFLPDTALEEVVPCSGATLLLASTSCTTSSSPGSSTPTAVASSVQEGTVGPPVQVERELQVTVQEEVLSRKTFSSSKSAPSIKPTEVVMAAVLPSPAIQGVAATCPPAKPPPSLVTSEDPVPTVSSSLLPDALVPLGEVLAPGLGLATEVSPPAPRSREGNSFAPPEPPSPVGSPANAPLSSSAGSDSSSLSGTPTAEEAAILEAQQQQRLLERKRTLASRLRPQEEPDTAERMRLNTLWAQFLFCFACGRGWAEHTVEAGCQCQRTLSPQMKDVEEEFGAIPGLEDS